MGIKRISNKKFKEIMDSIYRDCESVPCVATAKLVLKHLGIEIKDEIVQYSPDEAFRHLKPGTIIYRRGTSYSITCFKMINSREVFINVAGYPYNLERIRKDWTYADGSPCGMVKE